MKALTLAALCITPLYAHVALAADNAFLFGGGPNPENSQFSIESNVIWFDDVLKNGNFDQVITQFGSNQNNANEISYAVSQSHYQTDLIDILFGSANDANIRFRPALIGSDNNRTTEKEPLLNTLNEQISQLNANDSLFLTYSGHGGRAEGGKNNFLYLWNNTELSVSDMAQAMAKAHSESTVRYVLPQCYSGGFNRLAFKNLNPKQGLSEGAAVCGFTAVADDQLSEGCTESVNTEDYRDYASYFYAALTGSNRNGTPVTQPVDINEDGVVSLNEAHTYAYRYGNSSDIPRSTSEDYLLAIEHWSERWASTINPAASNQYNQTAAILGFDFDSEPMTNAFYQESAKKLKAAQLKADAVYSELRSTFSTIRNKREALMPALLLNWPQLSNPKTEQYHQTLAQEKKNILQWLATQEEMIDLVQLEKRKLELIDNNINTMRELARYQRIHRMLKLSRLHERLKNTGGEKWDNYLALQTCESWVPPLK
ncbi:C13 family peptidase [Reinekea marina]|uniref:C13 family peptidase n=1 Tax=Reinekea marina TaxID=1310421 RepID=A0ABV7WT35_9GAMM|nr:C13 family peptidase [Reinekea marina]MDN3648144.1 C13 family peptidase [Reinekea marina]